MAGLGWSKVEPIISMLMFVYHFLAINRLITICQVLFFYLFRGLIPPPPNGHHQARDGGWVDGWIVWRSSGSQSSSSYALAASEDVANWRRRPIYLSSTYLPLYRTHNDVQKKTWNVVTATELFRNGHHHLFKPGKSIRQTCLSIFYTHPPCRRLLPCHHPAGSVSSRKNATTWVPFRWNKCFSLSLCPFLSLIN